MIAYMFTLDHDAERNILLITATGFWSLADAASFTASALAKGAAIRSRHGHYAVLADIRNYGTQSSAVASAMGLLLPKTRLLTSGPIAIVCGSMLNKLQVDRVMGSERLRSFLEHDAASAWLESEGVASRAA